MSQGRSDPEEPSSGYRRPRQADVARVAGVSQSAVSVILSNKGGDRGIPEATRKRVLEVAASLGYVANSAARRLKGKNTRLLGVHTYQSFFPLDPRDYYFDFLIGIERAAREAGYDLVLFTATTHHDSAASAFVEAKNRLSVADGAVLLGYEEDRNELRRLREEGYPFVHVGRRVVQGVDIAWASANYAAGMGRLLHVLRAEGFRHPLYLGHTDPLEPQEDRQRGLLAAARRLHLPEPFLVRTAPGALTSEMLTGVQDVDVVIAEDLAHADATFRAMETAGIDLPVVLAELPSAADSRPYHAYLGFSREEMGRRAAELAVAIIEGRAPRMRQIMVECEIVRPER